MNDSSPESRADPEDARPLDLAFLDWFEAARLGRLALKESEVEPARGYQYVFVSGFHNEMMPLYFWGNLRELRRRGIPPKNLHRVHPSSHAQSDVIIDRLAASIERIADRNPGRLVIVGHSRGACVALAAALRRADWFCERLEAMFLIQGPFGGTAIADYVVAREHRFPSTWPLPRLGLARSLTSIERFALRLGWDAGIHDLTHEASRQFWAEEVALAREKFDEPATELGRRSFFITSRIDPGRSRFPRSELGRILEECDGPNDGVVATADQSIDGFGTRLGPIEAAHTDLVWGLYSTREARNDRRAIAQAILRVLAVQRMRGLPFD